MTTASVTPVYDAVTIDRARRLGTATLHEAAGRIGALPSAISAITPGQDFAGPAVTVSGPPADNLWLHRGIAAADLGEILLIEVGGHYESGYWGEVMAVAARARGVAGVVIDGCVRDSEALATVGVPVYARGLCIRGTDKDPDGRGAVNRPVTIGDVTVHSGDLVVGDADGVVVIPTGDVDQVLDAAQQRIDREAQIMDALRRGENSIDLLNLPKEKP
ncbi:RraA family protein [Gordonia terrae]